MNETIKEKRKNKAYNKKFVERCTKALQSGNPNSPEAIEKKKETFTKNKHQQGSNNSQYGTHWYVKETDKNLKKRKKFKENKQPQGWITTTEWKENRKKKNCSAYGKMWITNGEDNRFVTKETIIPDGWYKGRTL